LKVDRPLTMPSLRLLLPLLALLSACEGGGPVHFRVVNQGAGRVYLPGPEGFWQLSRGGRPLVTEDSCGICNCADSKCYVCGLTPGMVMPLEPGDALEWDWDGRIWREAGQKNGHPCQRAESLTPGPLTVTVVHGTQIRDAGAGGTFLDTPFHSTSAEFKNAADAQVEVVLH
jgi:hypothetical protein